MIKKDILIINSKSNIGITTLWTKKEAILNILPDEVKMKIGIIGTTYTSFGIHYMIETLAKNPQIDTLILYGADLSISGRTIYDIFTKKNEEVLKEYKIRFPYEKIKDILNTVKVIDLRDKFRSGGINYLIKTIEENYNPGKKFREPVDIVVEEKVELKSWPLPLSGYYIYDTSVFRAWIKILDKIMRFGSLKNTEYEESAKEFLNIMVTIGLYGKEYEIEKEFFEFIKPEDFERHIDEVISTKKPEGVDYTYGERLFSHETGKNQVEYVINKLSSVPYSRRALAVTWDHIKDPVSRNPPCIIFVQGIITDNYYNHIVVMRSNDMFRGWPLNIIGQIKLAEYIVKEINKRMGTKFEIGTVTTISTSAHIYQHDFDMVREVLSKYSNKMREFVEDPTGNFLIYIDNDKVNLEHRTPDNSSIDFEMSSKNFWDLYESLKGGSFFGLYDHALYIGKELKTAFEKLKRGEKYVQDEA